jgi:hypothetical protein
MMSQEPETVFIPGLRLGELFFHEAVEPILKTYFPDLRYAAALIGTGSEILGFDTARSTDHDWGPRVILFLSPHDKAQHAEKIQNILAQNLPRQFRGYSTNFSPPNLEDRGTRVLQVAEGGPINHRVQSLSLDEFVAHYLGFDLDKILAEGLSPVDWLTIAGQKLRAVIGGAVYHDDIGDLTRLRERLAYYPRDVWLYLLAAGWARIGEEEHFVGRTGSLGDDLGSRLITARLVHDLMNLAFLMEKQYAPYSKWFGTAFARLQCAPQLQPLLEGALETVDWQGREGYLTQAYQVVAEMHNALDITLPVSTQVTNFFSRPFRVIYGGRFADALVAQIEDTEVRRIAQQPLIGAVEQLSASTPFLSDATITRRASALYGKS